MEGYIGLCSEAKWSIVTAEPQLMAGYMAVAIRKQKNENEKKKRLSFKWRSDPKTLPPVTHLHQQ